MRIRTALLVGAVVLFLATGASSQEDDKWKRYEPRTLQSIKDSQMELLKSSRADLYFSAADFASKAKLVYLVSSRPLPEKKKRLLEAWKKMWGDQMPASVVDAFQTEFVFREGTEEQWIAVQKPLVRPLAKEAKMGQEITAYVSFVGAVKINDHWEWLFLMNEFDAS